VNPGVAMADSQQPTAELRTEPGFWRRMTRAERMWAGMTAIVSLGGMLLGLWLTPDTRGLGTHEQLGLMPCLTAAWLDIPCPFCGMTTAFSLMAHGRPIEGFRTQPVGALVFLGAVMGLVLSVAFGLTGQWPKALKTYRCPKSLWIGAIVLVLLAWAYKICVYR